MKLLIATLVTASLTLAIVGCKKSVAPSLAASASEPTKSVPQTPETQIRAAVEAHLAHNTNLNLKAFDMDMKQVTINGDHAQAQVDFHVKGGPGVMELTYQLQNREDAWAVIDSNPVGSNFSHPPLDQTQPATATPPLGGPSHSLADTLRSVRADGANPSPNLPAGHPPVSVPFTPAPKP